MSKINKLQKIELICDSLVKHEGDVLQAEFDIDTFSISCVNDGECCEILLRKQKAILLRNHLNKFLGS